MFNLFSRKPDSPTQFLEPSPDSYRQVTSDIATVQMMGRSAVATITVTELTHDTGADLLADLLEALGHSGAMHFVLDIQNVQFMDSACLGVLVEALNRLVARGGRIALVNGATSVQSLFRLTRLDRIFPVCKDMMTALQAVERIPGHDND